MIVISDLSDLILDLETDLSTTFYVDGQIDPAAVYPYGVYKILTQYEPSLHSENAVYYEDLGVLYRKTTRTANFRLSFRFVGTDVGTNWDLCKQAVERLKSDESVAIQALISCRVSEILSVEDRTPAQDGAVPQAGFDCDFIQTTSQITSVEETNVDGTIDGVTNTI